jgi:uncharacterized membrane protein YcaP (DUF421 family)
VDPVTPFEWGRLLWGVQPALFFLEIAFRVAAIYVFAVVVIRYMGKRGRQQMSSFEYVLIIALGSATGDSLFYPDVPILYAWLIILMMVLLDRGLAAWEARSERLNYFLMGKPRMVIQDGSIVEGSLERESINKNELLALIREQKIADLEEIGYAFFETTGRLGVIKQGDYDNARKSTFPEETAD